MLYDVHGVTNGLVHSVTGELLAVENVEFNPVTVTQLEVDSGVSIYPIIHVPYGQTPGEYCGDIYVVDGDADVADTAELVFYVDTVADVDIADNTGNLIGNVMSLSGMPGATVTGKFDLYNTHTPDDNVDPGDGPGNVEVTVTFGCSQLEHITIPGAVIPTTAIVLPATMVMPLSLIHI